MADVRPSKIDSMAEVTKETFAALRTEMTHLAGVTDDEEIDMDDPDEQRLQNCLRVLNMIENDTETIQDGNGDANVGL